MSTFSRRAFLGSAAFSLALGGVAAGAEKDAPPQKVKPKYELLLPRQYHGNEVNISSKEDWWGLFRTRNSYELRSTTLVISAVEDSLIDNGSGRKTGREVKVQNEPHPPLFLVKGLNNPKRRYVRTYVDARTLLIPGLNLKFGYCSNAVRDPVLAVYGKGSYERVPDKHAPGTSDYDEEIAAGNYELVLIDESTSSNSQVIYSRAEETSGAVPRLLWAGDLDNDGKPDLLLDLTYHYNVQDTTLFLSSEAGPKELVGKAASILTMGC